MGADLYINKLYQPNYDKYKDEFEQAIKYRDYCDETYGKESGESAQAQNNIQTLYEKMYEVGYFRDSYNTSSVLWQMGLSWWRDVIPLCRKSKNGNLNPQKLLDLIRPKMKAFKAKMKKLPGTKPESKFEENYIYTEEDAKYFLDKADKLIRFCEDAIKAKSRIDASL